MAVAAQEQWSPNSHGKTQPRASGKAAAVRERGKIEHFDTGTRQAAAQALQFKVVDKRQRWLLAATGVAGGKVTGAALLDPPGLCRHETAAALARKKA